MEYHRHVLFIFFRTMESSPLTSTMVVTWCCMQIAAAELDPGDLSNHSLTSVPQDLDPSVIRKLILDNNFITTISVDSVSRYTELTTLRLRHNPLKRIDDGSFDNNRKLTTLAMKKCPLAYLPSSPELWMTQLTTFNLQNSISENNLHLLQYPYFSYFTAMKKLYLNNIPLNDSTINTLSLPPTMETFDATNMGLTRWPNIGQSRLPNLKSLTASGVPFITISDSDFQDLADSLTVLILSDCSLQNIPNLALKVNLKDIRIKHNHLVTIPDLSSLQNLNNLFIKGNPITCDERMCWRRLWERFKAPFNRKDDVICQEPAELRNKSLSTVDPALMQCYDGKTVSRGLFQYQDRLPRYRNHRKDKMAVRRSYLYNENSYIGETESVY